MFVGENSENPIVLSSDVSTGDSPPAKGFSMQRYGPLEGELPRRRLFDVPRESGMYFRPVYRRQRCFCY